MTEGKEGIAEMMLYLSPGSIVNTTIRYCRNVARGIVNAVREKKINLLILGWHGKAKKSEFRIGSVVDSTIEQSPCDIVILKDVGQKKFKKILVPVTSGQQSAFALEIASLLADKSEGKIVARVHLDYDAIDKEHGTSKMDEGEAKKIVEQVLDDIKKNVNANIASYSRIHKVIEQPEEFVKTPTKKIKRYLYTNA